jgi:hypothetical protein
MQQVGADGRMLMEAKGHKWAFILVSRLENVLDRAAMNAVMENINTWLRACNARVATFTTVPEAYMKSPAGLQALTYAKLSR